MHRYLIILAGVVLAALAIWRPAPRPPQNLAPATATRAIHPRPHRTAPEELVVYVAGAVRRPGLYRLRAGARVADAVALAGGLLDSADPLSVNLAAPLNDGDEVAVVKPGALAHGSRSRARSSKRAKVITESVNVNSADATALARVPGIGATVARRIVELREQDGPFTTYDELLDVAGMTPARLERAQPHLIL
jgi:competence protein ComEA